MSEDNLLLIAGLVLVVILIALVSFRTQKKKSLILGHGFSLMAYSGLFLYLTSYYSEGGSAFLWWFYWLIVICCHLFVLIIQLIKTFKAKN